MITREATFEAADNITPAFAAELAHSASQFSANVYFVRENVKLSVDSLIGILSLDLRRGDRLTVRAEGVDEAASIDRICELLHG